MSSGSGQKANSDISNPQLFEISKKLDTLIRLFALALVKDATSQKEQIGILADAGLGPKQIAEILGTTANTVNVAIHEIRKKKAMGTSKERKAEFGEPAKGERKHHG